AILAASSLKYNQDRLSWNMGRAAGYAGVGGYTDYVFDSATSLLHPLLKSVYQRGVGYLELNPQASRTIEAVAVMMGGPYVRADVVINDNKSSPRAGSPLKELERIAAEQGYAVGVLIPSEDAVKEINT